jgi:hypothetical protein
MKRLQLPLILLLFCGAEMAASEPGLAATDRPARVARMSYLRGDVSFRPAGTEDWIPGELNRPLTTGDSVWTDSQSLAELHLGTASLRLDERTQAGLLEVGTNMTHVRLAEGTLCDHTASHGSLSCYRGAGWHVD